MQLAWRRRTWLESTASASPAFSASPRPYSAGKRRPPSAALAAVDDVVVDEERVVQQLDRDGDRQDVAVAPAERAARRHAQRGPDRLPRPARVRARDAVEPAVRLAVRDGVEHRAPDEPADVVGVRLDELGAVGGQHGSIATSKRQPETGRPVGLDRAAVGAGARRRRPWRARPRPLGSSAAAAASTSARLEAHVGAVEHSPVGVAAAARSAGPAARRRSASRCAARPRRSRRRRRRPEHRQAHRRADAARVHRDRDRARPAGLSHRGDGAPQQLRPGVDQRRVVTRRRALARTGGRRARRAASARAGHPPPAGPRPGCPPSARMPATGSNDSGNECSGPLSPSACDSSIALLVHPCSGTQCRR